MSEVTSTLVGKVVDILFGAAKTEISYIWNSSESVENFKREAEKLKQMKGRVQQQIDLAKSKGEDLLEGVNEWMEKADAEISDATKLITEEAATKKTCFNFRLCVNFKSMRHYGKMAIEKTSILEKRQKDGMNFETRVSLPTCSLGFADIYQGKNLQNIGTQKSCLKEIIQDIEDDTIQVVGINGLGGVGKTTLASEVAKQLKDQFAHIVFIAISKNIEKEKIMEKADVAARRIIKREKVLIILDDVWEELKMGEVGIPCGSDYMNCKILITSRNKDVCVAMNALKIISVSPLQPKEAWTLFERVVGENECDGILKEVALDIVKECGGLPLFLEVVGKALKCKDIEIWKAALKRLQDPTDKDLPYKRNGIMQLKLSYDHLESELAKSCFLLCDMFPEDATIKLKWLTSYGPALGIFNNPDSNIQLQDAKSRVQLAIDSFKSSSLLSHVENILNDLREPVEVLFKMHDLVRDMAIFIASTSDKKFWVQSGSGLKEWKPEKHLESCKKISLMGNNISKLPNHELLFPHLDTFLAQDNRISVVPDEFFHGMQMLKVLDMSNNFISSLPRSLMKLTELHTLDLSENGSLCEISSLGELTCLVILKLRRTGITNIPKEIGQIKNLRLEELYFWIERRDCSFLVELTELKSLKILHLHVPELDRIPEDFHFESLIEFDIENAIPRIAIKYKGITKRHLRISGYSFPLEIPVMKLIQVSDRLELHQIKDLDNILPDLYPGRSDELRVLSLYNCEDVTSLVKKTCDREISLRSDELGLMERKGESFPQVKEKELRYLGGFSNLRSICIWECGSILELFPLSVAQALVNLSDLYISICRSLVVVISARDEQTEAVRGKTKLVTHDIVFPQLARITLDNLHALKSFYSGHLIIKYPSLKSLRVYGCRSMKMWSYVESHISNIKFELQGKKYSNIQNNNINDYLGEQEHDKSRYWMLDI